LVPLFAAFICTYLDRFLMRPRPDILALEPTLDMLGSLAAILRSLNPLESPARLPPRSDYFHLRRSGRCGLERWEGCLQTGALFCVEGVGQWDGGGSAFSALC
jgi:hypothetical protein